ncbi:MAG: protein kinase [Lentisphaeria bacterium]|jgi:serine/threonine protein kinase
MATTGQISDALKATGKYADLVEIHEGANAFAFKARHTHLDRDVFLKVYDYIHENRSGVLREPRLLVEATKAPSLCPNLVQVFDAEIMTVNSSQFLCLQMEYVSGVSLLGKISDGPLGQQDAVRVTAGILTGVAHLHLQQMVHRDLKPANILLHGNTPRISDFGSVALLAGDDQPIQASKHSVLYVPPEGWETPSKYLTQSDLYQVGMVLYELVNGQLDYHDEHYLSRSKKAELRRRKLTFSTMDSFEKSRAVDDGIADFSRRGKLLEHGRTPRPYFSSKLSRLVRATTNPDCSKRPRSASEFLSDLTRITVPNWLADEAGVYTASDWRRWDWRVRQAGKTGQEVVVERSKHGQGSWRRYPGSSVATLADAFSLVEALS